MTLEQLKVRLQVSLDDTSKDATYQAWLDDAIDFAIERCGEGITKKLPSGVRRAIVLLVKGMNESNVSSQSLGAMSKSFFKTEYGKEALELLEDYIGYDPETKAPIGGGSIVTFIPMKRRRS